MKISELYAKLNQNNIPFYTNNFTGNIEISPVNCITISNPKIQKNYIQNKTVVLFVFQNENIIDQFCKAYNNIDINFLIIMNWSENDYKDKIDFLTENLQCPIVILHEKLSYLDFIYLISESIDSSNNVILNQIREDLSYLFEKNLHTIENIINLLYLYIKMPIILLSRKLNVLYSIGHDDIDFNSSINNLSNFIKSNNYIDGLYEDCSIVEYEDNKFILDKIIIGNSLVGYLSILLNNSPHSFIPKLSINLKPYLSIAIMNHCKNDFTLTDTKEEFIKGLVLGVYDDKSTIIRESDFHNLEYNSKNFIWILEVLDDREFKKGYSLQNDIKLILNIVHRYFKENLFFYHTNKIVSLHKKDSEPNSVIKSKMEKLLKNLRLQFPKYKFKIGISRAYENLEQLKFAYSDCIFSLKISSQLHKNENDILYYDDIIIYHLIMDIVKNPIINRIYNNTILKLIHYDEQENSDMVKTLSYLIESNYNIKDTANKLFIHRNTLYNKLKKIETIIGQDINNADTRLLLQLSLKIHKVLCINKKPY